MNKPRIVPTRNNNYNRREISPLIKLIMVVIVIQIILCCLWFVISSIELSFNQISDENHIYNDQSYLKALESMNVIKYP